MVMKVAHGELPVAMRKIMHSFHTRGSVVFFLGRRQYSCKVLVEQNHINKCVSINNDVVSLLEESKLSKRSKSMFKFIGRQ